MTFSYRILGRTPGCPDAAHYAGMVEADTPKEALVKSLASEFVDRDSTQSDAVEALVGSGWVDRETLSLAIEDLQEDDNQFCLDLGDLTFDVAVDTLD
jgi:hypothetical protein